MLILAFVKEDFDGRTWGGATPPPAEPQPDPPRRGGQHLSSDWSIFLFSLADMGFLVWSWLDPLTPCLYWLPMVPTGLAFGSLLAMWLSSLVDESLAIHPGIWLRMKHAMLFFATITVIMPGAVRLVHLHF